MLQGPGHLHSKIFALAGLVYSTFTLTHFQSVNANPRLNLFSVCVQANGLSNKHNQDHDLQSDSKHFRFCSRKASEHEK